METEFGWGGGGSSGGGLGLWRKLSRPVASAGKPLAARNRSSQVEPDFLHSMAGGNRERKFELVITEIS